MRQALEGIQEGREEEKEGRKEGRKEGKGEGETLGVGVLLLFISLMIGMSYWSFMSMSMS